MREVYKKSQISSGLDSTLCKSPFRLCFVEYSRSWVSRNTMASVEVQPLYEMEIFWTLWAGICKMDAFQCKESMAFARYFL